ncbi:MAG: hypothetical protein V4650_10045 [Pseudomonadota bacterium]
MRVMHEKPLLIVLSGLLGALPLAVGAQQSHACGQMIEPVERLACYDQAFPPARPVVEAAVEKGVRQFGLDAERRPTSDAAPEQITSRIARLQESRNGQRTITLENGQVWQLDGSRGALDEGDAITVRKAALGGHMAVTPAGVRLRASRLQ